MTAYSPGTLVKCRGREWVVLPSSDKELMLLRPLAGSDGETCGIYLPLRADPIESATFPLPNTELSGDYTSAVLLRDAARLALRSGAGPFRSLGHISVYPRPYQLVPMIMALRQDIIRLLIADDVGIGKTIEAGLIAREMLDRGEIHRIAVICPPQLCDQWRDELHDKFNLEAEVIRGGTAERLRRALPPGDISIFEHYRHIVVSVDYVKSDRNRDAFLQHCPEFVIVDEAHTCAKPPGQRASQQQRHDLLVRVAKKNERHLVLLTATPHSGIEESFLSILGLLNPKFATINMTSTEERDALAKHFVQRQRAHVKEWLGETRFPERDPSEETYQLSKEYKDLFNDVYEFAKEIVASSETLSGWKQRVRYWAALALLRSVMSSPAAAVAAFEKRLGETTTPENSETITEDEAVFLREVDDSTEQEVVSDGQATFTIEQGEQTLPDSDKKRIRQFAAIAEKLKGDQDHKLQKTIQLVEKLIKEGRQPIIYCRYIATAQYVAEALKNKLESKFKNLQIIALTGETPDEERETRIKELAGFERHVLVATDCLSEGINLQKDFNAVLHYDLPWNPNRLQQREGRVDRFGQESEIVKTILLWGVDNLIDGAVLNVLLRKAVTIHKRLGISVPLPANSQTVMETVLKFLFFSGQKNQQMTFADLGVDLPDVGNAWADWDKAADREKEIRSRFAQKAIKPDEVEPELKETNSALGDQQTVETFVRSACERLGSPLEKIKEVWRFNTQSFPPQLRNRLWKWHGQKITFADRSVEGVLTIRRNHLVVESLANYLLDTALEPTVLDPKASRSGIIRTDSVSRLTTILLLRLRYLLESDASDSALLAEEVMLRGFQDDSTEVKFFSEEETFKLLNEAKPSANVSLDERKHFIREAITIYEKIKPKVEVLANERAEQLGQSHQRVRKMLKEKRVKVKPQLPVDLLGIYVLAPIPKGVQG